ncbi:glycoside hydrolase family 16 protein [Lophiostoma macrostomum CBS 122681]|uniref:Glycoside hydrolase family 16 protein n=1 Tax=Lophiostoma macrostomum CBS 122681 TaxID=1314788 RepID=A0A6A6TEJ6_9PLEO|nr:glycoside hydrolase family 16 protein [Lophiostoma macrostomum CBS 122681]
MIMEMVLLLLSLLFRAVAAATKDVSSCSCGFLDSRTGKVWTDAIITYGNETDELPPDALVTEDYQHPYEQNWNARYRAGAASRNVGSNDSSSPGWTGNAWTLSIDRPTKHHAVVGASIRSLRTDIQYGTFESYLGPPKAGVGGSVLEMRLQYNDSQTLAVSVMNADAPTDAWTSFLVYGEWRGSRDKGLNFTDFGNSSYNYQPSPWGLVPYRMDWTDYQADFFIGDAKTRSVHSGETGKPWPVTPSTLYMRHFSIGDMYTSEGPPPNGSYAHVGMVRAFFNSSLMSASDHVSYDARCHQSGPTCRVQDTTLRGASPFAPAAAVPYKEKGIDYTKRWPAIFICAVCIAASTVLLLHALIKRAPWKKTPDITSSANDSTLSVTPSSYFSEHHGMADAAQTPGTGTPGAITPAGARTPRPRSEFASGWSTPQLESVPMPAPYWRNSLEITPINDQSSFVGLSIDEKKGRFVEQIVDKTKQPDVTVKEVPPLAAAPPPIAPKKARVDYLAGLVALASVLVTLIHFCLTFLPATEIPYTHAHYESENWALKIVSPYLLTFSWIGPFFTSSTRFLVMSYLKSGNLKGVAEKTVGRTPRLIIPCAAIAALEYFCMQVGAITWLEYLASVTWSTWPYTSNYVTFGHFISEVIELMYIIPNAVPQITFNYCIGVLWTIPVQLQNSWTSLLAVIIIREIKTPWKRMAYYAFCIVMHWYAMSWGSFFWAGLLIADLDISYKWKTWLYARKHVYYPFIIFCILLAIGSPSIDLVGQWKTWNFNTLEYGVHIHQASGHRIRDSPAYGYPPYYLPRLTALTFSIGFHLLVELSPLVQKFFSNRLLMWLFPHILTLYLIHGLVFWSLGSVICVHLSAHGVPYWANMLVVATCCYTVIFGCLPILTPVIETLGKSITMNIWRDASQKPPVRRKTLFPFDAGLLADGERNLASRKRRKAAEAGDVERDGGEIEK